MEVWTQLEARRRRSPSGWTEVRDCWAAPHEISLAEDQREELIHAHTCSPERSTRPALSYLWEQRFNTGNQWVLYILESISHFASFYFYSVKYLSTSSSPWRYKIMRCRCIVFSQLGLLSLYFMTLRWCIKAHLKKGRNINSICIWHVWL